jgi:hypothetical protein
MPLTRAELEAALRRAENAGDDESAEKIAVLLAPFVDADVAELERRDVYSIPMWGTDV